MQGEVLANRYRVERLLGEGAMGQVWLVEDTTTGAEVALKVIACRQEEPGAAQGPGGREKSRLDFIQEFRLMTQLRHQNCCEVIDYGLLPGDAPYMTMEHVPGHGLDELGRLDTATFDRVFAQILLALSYIHVRGLVHCDLKAANVRVRPDGLVKVMDYGLMEYAGQSGGPIRGTLAYLAPEVIRRGLIDRRTDLYALGVLAFELLTGRQPFLGTRAGDILRAHIEAAPPDPAALVPGLEPRLGRAVLRLLAKEPLERYQSADEVMGDLGYEAPAGIGGTLLTSPMVGRAPEMARLFVQLARITSGKRGAVVFVSGASGLGKSRLAKEFSFNARLENLPTAEAGHAPGGRVPYAPFITVLRALLPALREHVPLLLEALAPVLGRLLPEIAVLRPPELDAASEKARLHAAITEAILGLARVRGTLVVLEDLQRADPLSVEVLEHLVRNRADAALLLVVTSQGELPEGWGDGVTRIPLGPLSEAGLTRMVGSMLGSPHVDPGLLSHVGALSGGNPRHVEILLEYLARSGALAKQRDGWALTGPLSRDDVPVGIDALLADKLAALLPESRRIACVAAVIGEPATLDVLREVSSLSDSDFLDGLDPLLQAQVLVTSEEGAWGLARGPLEQVALAGVAADELRRLHGRVAAALLRRAGDPALGDLHLDVLGPVADHLLQGDDPEQALQAALDAGLRLSALSALDEALRYLEAGRALLADVAPNEFLSLSFAHAIGAAQLRQGRLDAARAAFSDAVPLAEALGDRFLLGQALLGAGAAELGLERLDTALAFGERAHRVALDALDQAGAARARLLAGRAAGSSGRTGEAFGWLQEAEALARQGEDPAVLAEALAELGYAQIAWQSDGLEAGIEAGSEALAIVTRLGDRRGSIRALMLLGQARLATGDARGARELLERARALAVELGDSLDACEVSTLLALAAQEFGEFDTALEVARTAADEAGRLGSSFLLGSALMAEALASVWLGRFNEATALMGVAFDQAASGRHVWRESRMRALQAEVLAAMGRYPASMASAERLQDLMVETGNLEPQGRLCLLWAENLMRAGDPAEAEDYVGRALGLADAGRARGVRLRELLLGGRLALQRERWEEAGRRAFEALDLARELGARHLEAVATALHAEWALATQEPGADVGFARVVELAEALGTPLLLAQGLFGRAAAQPYGEGAAAWASQAARVLDGVLAPLSPDDRAAVLAPLEVRRVHEGNFIGFSLPRQVARTLPSPKVNPRMWGPPA